MNQHTSSWIDYQLLRKAQKPTYFDRHKPDSVCMFMPKVKDAMLFSISALIVEDLIGGVFFNPDDDVEGDGPAITKANAMKLFRVQDDGSYQVRIKNELRFNLSMDYVSVGLSFRQTASAIRMAQIRLKNPLLVGLNDHMVGQFARIIVGAALQDFGNLLSIERIWAFALAFDSSTHQATSFFDIRIRLPIRGNVYNLHLVAVPNFDRHTAVNTAALIYTIMDSIFSEWRTKLIGVSTDGENTMTGRHGGVVTLLERQATNKIVRVWCPIHQADLVVKKCINLLGDGLFYKQAHNLSVHLRKQANLIRDMKTTCPKDTNRWVHFGNMIKWMLEHRRRILEHIVEKEPVCAPSEAWWILCAAVAPLILTLNTTLVILQGRDLVLSQQQREIDNLIGNLCTFLQMKTDDEIDLTDKTANKDFVQDQGWCVLIDDVATHCKDQGSWSRDALSALSNNEQQEALLDIAHFSLHLVAGLSEVQAERNSNNEIRELESPPVMPADLVTIRTSKFIEDLLDPHREHISQFWNVDEIDMIEKDHQALRSAFHSEVGLKEKIALHDHETMFNVGWDTFKGRFSYLRQFVAGLGSVFANTASVESDFSVLKWEMDEFRSSMASLTLEGVLQSKQRTLLSSLAHQMTHGGQ